MKIKKISELRSLNEIPLAVTFDDILLIPWESKVLPGDVDVSTHLTNNIRIAKPIVAAAMDTVSGSRMAITMAQQGGVAVIHKNMSIDEQVEKTSKVKRFQSAIVQTPIVVHPGDSVRKVIEMVERHKITGHKVTGFPVTRRTRLIGIVTKRDYSSLMKEELDRKVEEIMTTKIITAPPDIDMEEAKKIMDRNKIEKLPLVDKKGNLKGLITQKDIKKRQLDPKASKDELGRLLVAAAVGISKETMDRAQALVDVEVDILCIDSAHAASYMVIDMIKKLRERFTDTDIIAGNVATYEATWALCEIGVNAVKVGVGPGSICTTRVIAGVGVPQVTAVFDSFRATRDFAEKSNQGIIPVIADGGIRWSGDIVKALAFGASSVMLGKLFAGTDESPGETIIIEGKRYKRYRAMGSEGAMKISKDRYFQEGAKKTVPEGVEGRVPYKGSVADVIYQLVGGLQSGMGYIGASNISELQRIARPVRQTTHGLRESHPHDIEITKESSNYIGGGYNG